MNLASLVRVNARNHPEKAAIRHSDTVLTYRDAWTAVERIASLLVAEGVSAGDRVGLALGDHSLHLLAHYAIARIGAVILPIDHRWTDREKAAAAATFSAKTVLTDGDPIGGTATLGLDADRLQDVDAGLPALLDTDSDLLISLSSGTTGRPKGAIVTHRNLYERFVSQWVAIGLNARDEFALVTPLYFGAGRSFGMCMLAAGATVKLAPPPAKPPEIIAAVADPAVTATFLPPTLLRRLLPLAGPGEPLFVNLRCLLISGEPLYAAEAAEVRAKISDQLVGYYASSEGGGISVLTAPEFETHAATVGKPTFRTEVEIVDADDNPLAPGAVGRLRYRGPGVATRFLDSDGRERRAAEGGWFYPGDLAERLETGHIALRGRDRDVIIRGGVNVYPAEIEAALQQHPGIRECAVVGVDDPDRGQAVVAFVAGSASAESLDAFCRERLAPYKVPAEFRTLPELPKAGSGKIDKTALTRTGRQP